MLCEYQALLVLCVNQALLVLCVNQALLVLLVCTKNYYFCVEEGKVRNETLGLLMSVVDIV